MNTYREIVYMCLDQVKLISDDAYYTQDHIIFLADKYRAVFCFRNTETWMPWRYEQPSSYPRSQKSATASDTLPEACRYRG